MSLRTVFTLLASTTLATAASAASWDLAADYLTDTNPNGAWAYGENPGSTFSALAWNVGTGSYGIGSDGHAFIYKRTVDGTDFGIGAGKVSLEADWGNPTVRWTAPTAGAYTFAIAVGGSTARGPRGYGNNFARHAGVQVNGLVRVEDAFVSNVKTWNFTATLNAGDMVDTYVLNPGFADGGNTQTEISVSSVPEPSSMLLLALGIGALALRRSRAGTADAAGT